MIDFLAAMTGLDFLFVVVWVGSTIYGAASGVVRQALVICCILIAAVLASAIAPVVANWTGPFSGVTRDHGIPLTYAALYFILLFILLVLRWRSYHETRLSYTRRLDVIGGTVLGFIAGVVAVAQLVGVLLVATEYEWGYVDGTRTYLRLQLETTPFVPLLAEIFSPITASVKGWLPFFPSDSCTRCL
jgi:uncharacterized membrane protein required for colicin V production